MWTLLYASFQHILINLTSVMGMKGSSRGPILR